MNLGTSDPGDLLAKIFNSYRPKLVRYVETAFPRLADEAEDIVHDIWVEIHTRQASEGACDPQKLPNYLFCTVRRRSIDRLRTLERRVFHMWQERVSGSEEAGRREPADERARSPSSQCVEVERRRRQGLLLSDILAEFCRWCEARPQRVAIKEAYERSLRGQTPAEIASAMGVSPSSVYQWLHQARDWVRRRLAEKDVDQSVFLTLYRAK